MRGTMGTGIVEARMAPSQVERVLPRIHPQSLFLFPRLLSFQVTKKENIGTSPQMLKEGIAKGYKPFNKLCNTQVFPLYRNLLF